MNKMIITRWKGQLLTATFTDEKPVELGIEADTSILGNIYIGIVKRIVRNLNAAFVDFGEARTGYYSLSDNPVSLHADGTAGAVRCGDEIIVQVAKEAVKTKDPVLTANLTFPGRYAILTARQSVGFSARINDREWKDALRPELTEALDGRAGVIVRTNAWQNEDALFRELSLLMEAFQKVMQGAPYRKAFSLLWEAEPEYVRSIQNCPPGSFEEIITDVSEVCQTLTAFFRRCEPESVERVRFYEDKNLSLEKLYSLETVLERALQKRVWLNSGGYLVIEPTEALTVIDVNTGKYTGKKSQEETIRLINLEAAREIAHQVRLRNISGIVMIDFIDMKSEENKKQLLETLRQAVRPDPVKTTVVDMTALDLVEMTRKKEKKPLWEQIAHMEKG
ncbi:MAG: ribonuclease E/G [Clostridiales bacterium]|nr:ribonuclease E/G [Clostridiales bacterium]